MHLRLLASCVFLLPVLAHAAGSDSVVAPLWAYNGTWQVTKNHAPKPDILVNQCSAFANYFACQQTVNGQVSALLVFIPGRTPGQFSTQSIMPDGRAGGRGDLKLEGNTWTYLNRWNQGTKITYYRVLNVYQGKNRIHFEQQESDDGKDWKTTSSGEEVRVAASQGKATPR